MHKHFLCQGLWCLFPRPSDLPSLVDLPWFCISLDDCLINFSWSCMAMLQKSSERRKMQLCYAITNAQVTSNGTLVRSFLFFFPSLGFWQMWCLNMQSSNQRWIVQSYNLPISDKSEDKDLGQTGVKSMFSERKTSQWKQPWMSLTVLDKSETFLPCWSVSTIQWRLCSVSFLFQSIG